VSKLSAVGQPTKQTQHVILPARCGVDKWVVIHVKVG